MLYNGLNVGLRQKLGMNRVVMSEAHSISIGFDMKPAGRHAFNFPALTYYPERPAERVALITMFPIGSVMRANLFVYRDLHDSWLRALRDAPQQTLFATLPGLQAITGPFEVTDFIKIRPIDLYVTEGHRQAGIVLVGDAFATSCPAAGTGAGKVLTDVERLCNVHIPHWLATPGMDVAKIAAFYDDPVKRAYDEHSRSKAYHLRSYSTERSLPWRARRATRFMLHWGRGTMRALSRPASRLPARPGVPAASGAAS